MRSDLITRDHQYFWHPCAQMKDYETFLPSLIVKAEGCYFELVDGKKILDVTASWWCKSLGHQHPRLKEALLTQANKFEHVLMANNTYEEIILLSEKLASLLPPLSHVSYASDGANVVEMAMKMSFQAQQFKGEAQRTQFGCLTHSYHGETLGALSVTNEAAFCEPYQKILQTGIVIKPPYVLSEHDALWEDCRAEWLEIEKSLEQSHENLVAMIVEPIVQGAGGMRMISKDFFKRLRAWTKAHGIYLIVDEIFTAFGRTGKMLACEYAEITPDFLCLGKALTAGWLPLSAVLVTDEIYQAFYNEYATGNSFIHSHTYSGNALAVSIALEAFKLHQQIVSSHHLHTIHELMMRYMTDIANHTGILQNVRGIGATIAADIMVDSDLFPRAGYQFFQRAVELGAYIRPLGNALYWTPPLTISPQSIEEMATITEDALRQVFLKTSKS